MPPRWSRYAWIGAPVVAAAGLFLVLRPATPSAGFVAKGSGASSVVAECLGAKLSACPRGSKLVFRVEATDSPLFLHAYADPVDSGCERVWYFPTAATPPFPVAPGPEARTLDKGILVGPEHGCERYRLHVVLGPSVLSKEQLLALAPVRVANRMATDLKVVDR
jgi:hypothetical protein